MVDKLRQLLDQGCSRHLCPGAALAVVEPDGEPRLLTAGRFTYAEMATRIGVDSLFDLASLTKVLVTTTLVAQLYEQGRLDLDAPCEFLPSRPTPRDLLAHCSGFPPTYPLWKLPPGTDWLPLLKPETEPRTASIYSDLNFLLLGEMVTRLEETPLDVLAARRIFCPLNLQDTCFCPLSALRPRCVPTEIRPGDTVPLQGTVHDENAAWLGGVAGHAGLFSSLRDLARYAQGLLRGGEPMLSPKTLKLFTTRANLVPGSSRCLGWDSPSLNSSAGQYIAPTAFGHTGFTGTSLWISPEQEKAVVLLTNAVFPRREAKGEDFFAWRRQLHDLVF